MKLRQIVAWALLAAPLALASCDEVDYRKAVENIVKEDPDTVGVAEVPVRRAVLFDFTGQLCGNCPRGHEIAEALAEEKGDAFIPVGIHCGFFAEPLTNGTKYRVDYRTVAGDKLDAYYGASNAGLPRGIIQGVKTSLSSPAAWTTQIENVYKDSIYTALSLRVAPGKVKVNLTQTREAASPYELVLYRLQDSILGMQKDYSKSPQDQIPYYQRHMLRDSAVYVPAFLKKGFKGVRARTYYFSFPDSIKPWNNEVVAILRDSTSKILQAAKAKASAQ